MWGYLQNPTTCEFATVVSNLKPLNTFYNDPFSRNCVLNKTWQTTTPSLKTVEKRILVNRQKCLRTCCSINNEYYVVYRPVGWAVTRSSLEREVWGSKLGPVKSDTVLPTARHRCDISSKELCCLGAMTRRWAPPTCYTLRPITASIMKDLTH